MTWQPGQPVAIPDDVREWRAWRRERVLSAQRSRRATLRRIDFYPTDEAAAIIDAVAADPEADPGERTYGATISWIVTEWDALRNKVGESSRRKKRG